MMHRTNTHWGKTHKSQFPFAPDEWTESDAEAIALREGVTLSSEHWELLKALQEYFAKHEKSGPNMRELHDALDEKFHSRGGMKYLYTLFPEGPVAQGGRIAGLNVPAGANDQSFGSVQ